MTKVLIYSTPTCVYCKMAKAFLQNHNISYEEKDVATDEKARKEMIDKSGQLGVPVIDIDGQIIVGYNEVNLKDLLKIK